jgi:tetratricopeptide (TPR) repeat protein
MNSIFVVAWILMFGFAGFAGANDLPELQQGIAFAEQGDYSSAHKMLFEGWTRTRDPRFLPELAGASYRLGDHQQAKKYLRQILDLRPNDRYANNFLGSLFLLEGNPEAGLKYWNRIGKPSIDQILVQPGTAVDAEILDRAMAAAPSSFLRVEDYLETQQRLEMMGMFKTNELLLKPHGNEEKFDLVFQSRVRKGTFDSKMQLAKLAAQGLFTQTIKPEFVNLGGTSANLKSLFSWDEYRYRAYASLSLPFQNRPHQRIRVFTDARQETWQLGSDLHLSRAELGMELQANASHRLRWSGGAKASFRDFQNSTGATPFQEDFTLPALEVFSIH